MNKKIKIFLIIAVTIIAIGGLIFLVNNPIQQKSITGLSQEAGGIIAANLENEGISWNKISVENNNVIVAYQQPEIFTQDELLANWLYIMISAAQNCPQSTVNIILECNFENGEKLQASVSVADIISFSNKEITAEEILSRISVEALTKGPVI
jgi:hypothetical protein